MPSTGSAVGVGRRSARRRWRSLSEAPWPCWRAAGQVPICPSTCGFLPSGGPG